MSTAVIGKRLLRWHVYQWLVTRDVIGHMTDSAVGIDDFLYLFNRNKPVCRFDFMTSSLTS